MVLIGQKLIFQSISFRIFYKNHSSTQNTEQVIEIGIFVLHTPSAFIFSFHRIIIHISIKVFMF